MITARPEVKRTYSRLKKTEDEEINCNKITCENANFKETFDNKSEVPVSEIQIDAEVELEVVKTDKLRKITDFFRFKRDQGTPFISKSKCTTSELKSSLPITSTVKQTYLDLGQKNIMSSQCPECLMHYNKSFSDDLALHKKFHSQYLKGYNFNLKVDNETCKELSPGLGDEIIHWSKYRFYEVSTFEGNLGKKLEFFLNFIHVQLGAEPLTLKELKETGRYSAILAVEHSSQRIVGFGLFEKCKKVYKSKIDCDNSSIELDDEESFGFKDHFIGISRIWIDSKHRSKGLASLILDLKCTGKRESMAFSQPTPAGFAFAKKYQSKVLAGRQCLIYLQ